MCPAGKRRRADCRPGCVFSDQLIDEANDRSQKPLTGQGVFVEQARDRRYSGALGQNVVPGGVGMDHPQGWEGGVLVIVGRVGNQLRVNGFGNARRLLGRLVVKGLPECSRSQVESDEEESHREHLRQSARGRRAIPASTAMKKTRNSS